MFFGDCREELLGVRHEVEEFLACWRLRVHPDKSVLRRVGGGMPFLGFRVYPDHRLLLGRNVRRFRRRLRRMQESYALGGLSAEEVRCRLESWSAHARHGDTYHLRRCLLDASVFRRRGD